MKRPFFFVRGRPLVCSERHRDGIASQGHCFPDQRTWTGSDVQTKGRSSERPLTERGGDERVSGRYCLRAFRERRRAAIKPLIPLPSRSIDAGSGTALGTALIPFA
jgi:hypothetical protein